MFILLGVLYPRFFYFTIDSSGSLDLNPLGEFHRLETLQSCLCSIHPHPHFILSGVCGGGGERSALHYKSGTYFAKLKSSQNFALDPFLSPSTSICCTFFFWLRICQATYYLRKTQESLDPDCVPCVNFIWCFQTPALFLHRFVEFVAYLSLLFFSPVWKVCSLFESLFLSQILAFEVFRWPKSNITVWFSSSFYKDDISLNFFHSFCLPSV